MFELENIRLSHLPGYGKLFVAAFTTLMIAVVIWVALIYQAEKGSVDPENLPAYLSDEQAARLKESIAPSNEPAEVIAEHEGESRWRKNLGLAHTHINGQSLLFFALGTLFLFTAVPARTKKIVYLVFASAIVVHAVGLSGEGYHPLFDDILSLSGLAIVLSMMYMVLMIYVDLGRKRSDG